MQTIEYDLNVSGGLMPQINALTAPPASEESTRKKKLKKTMARQTPISNDTNNNSNYNNSRPMLSRQTKTGKAPNHEYCDSCREGGDLLCCDRCPNAFHLQCHDPPLDEEDVPQGEWLCRKCKQLVKEEVDESDEESDESEEVLESKDNIQKPFSLLIRAAQTLNPKQFQLPNDLMPSIQLVGTSRRGNNKNGKKQIHEMDNNIVAFPVKLCYQCSKSCRKAPLIQCDYCPLLFHPDCLDPPLTVLPTGRWMCPNHSQHIIEQKLLDSVSLSERIKLWDQFSGSVSHDVIQMEFFKKVHRVSPPFRTKIGLPINNKVVVPEAIKQMYKIRPSLLPNSNQLALKMENNECLTASKNDRPTAEQQEEWLSSLIAFQSSVAQYLSSSKCTNNKPNSSIAISSSKDISDLNSKLTENSVKINSHTSMNGPIDQSFEDNISLKKDTNSDLRKDTSSDKNNNNNNKEFIQMNGNISCSSPVSSDKRISISNNHFNAIAIQNIESIADLSRLDDIIVRQLAYQRIQQIRDQKAIDVNHNMNVIQNQSSLSSSSSTTPSFQTTIRRIGLNDVRARAVLCPILIKSSTGSSNGPTIVMSYRTLTIGTSCDNDVVLGDYGHCNYVSPKHASIFYDETSHNYELINYSEHGTTVDNVLYSCDFSDKKIHNTKHINSHTVSTVKDLIDNKKRRKSIQNNKKIKNSDKESSPEKRKPNTNGNNNNKKRKTTKIESTEESAQKDNDFKTNKIIFRKDFDSENIERVTIQTKSPLTMSSRSGQTHKPCACKASCSSLIGPNGAGWEGTALLHHGSHIKVGCKEFIFSITNNGITQTQTNSSISSSPKNAIKIEK